MYTNAFRSTPNFQLPTPNASRDATLMVWELGVFISVHNPVHKPRIRPALAEHAVRGAVAQRRVPLVALPGVRSPPGAGGSPGTGGPLHSPAAEPTPIDR